MKFYNFYRCFVYNFFKIVRSLIQLTQKNMFFVWFKSCQQAFKLIKKNITSISVLRHYDRTRKTILKIVSLNYVNDEILSQQDDNEVLHSVTFFSKSMLLVKCNYKIYDKKLLIIIKCLKHWRSKLKVTDLFIEIYTNHKSLKHFMTSKKFTRRQARWFQKLSKFNFKIMY